MNDENQNILSDILRIIRFLLKSFVVYIIIGFIIVFALIFLNFFSLF